MMDEKENLQAAPPAPPAPERPAPSEEPSPAAPEGAQPPMTRETLMAKLGLSDEQLSALVESLPEVQAAKEQLRAAQEAEAQLRLEAEVREIAKYDAAVTGLAQLAESENYPQLCEMILKGYTLSDAWKLANFESLMELGTKGARQALLNELRSKRHLTRTQTVGDGGVSVPADVKRLYRALNPTASDAEIARHYARQNRA